MIAPQLQCVTIGVPIQYAAPPLLSGAERAMFDQVYTNRMRAPIVAADAVALIVRATKTVECYDTKGQVTRDEELLSSARGWSIRQNHKRRMLAIGLRFKLPFMQVIALDQSFRMKRLKGKTLVGKKHLVYYESLDRHDCDQGLVGAWFDISLKPGQATQRHIFDSSSPARSELTVALQAALINKKNPRCHRICGLCGAFDTPKNKHQRCGRCLMIAYCSVKHQKDHWSVHKKKCCCTNKSNN